MKNTILFQVNLPTGTLRIDIPVSFIQERLDWLKQGGAEREAKRLEVILSGVACEGAD